jgi:hypothetical protein
MLRGWHLFQYPVCEIGEALLKTEPSGYREQPVRFLAGDPVWAGWRDTLLYLNKNRVNLNNPNRNIISPDFGRITGAGSARTGQIGVRLTF